MTDYGTVVLACIAAQPGRVFSANDVAQETQLALPSVRKLLKVMSNAGLLASFRGANGGYRLARPAGQISAAQILDALEGPVTLTECSARDSHCRLEKRCGVGRSWQQINHRIRRALDDVSLAQLVGDDALAFNFSLSVGTRPDGGATA